MYLEQGCNGVPNLFSQVTKPDLKDALDATLLFTTEVYIEERKNDWADLSSHETHNSIRRRCMQ